jgi:hypothetical protein
VSSALNSLHFDAIATYFELKHAARMDALRHEQLVEADSNDMGYQYYSPSLTREQATELLSPLEVGSFVIHKCGGSNSLPSSGIASPASTASPTTPASTRSQVSTTGVSFELSFKSKLSIKSQSSSGTASNNSVTPRSPQRFELEQFDEYVIKHVAVRVDIAAETNKREFRCGGVGPAESLDQLLM